MGSSGLQNSDHKYWAYLIWIKCSLRCSLLTWLCWLESHQIFPCLRPSHTSHFLIKRKECWGDLRSTVRKRRREIVFLSCGRDARSQRCYSTPTDSQKGKKRTLVKPALARVCSKKPTIMTCFSSPRPVHFLPDLSLTTSVCQSRQDFTHLLRNISSVWRGGKKKKCLREKERDRPISLKDLTNVISQRFISVLAPNGF